MMFSTFLRVKSHAPQVIIDLRRALHNADKEPTTLPQVLECLRNYHRSMCHNRPNQTADVTRLWEQYERVQREAA